MENVSKSEFARRLGVSKPRVSQLVSKGLPVQPDGRIDLAAALQWVAERIDRSQVTRRGGAPAVAARPGLVAPASRPATPTKSAGDVFEPDTGAILLRAKAKKAILDFQRAERLEKIAAGEVVIAAEIRAEYDARVRNTRSKLLSLGHRLAPRLAIETDATACKAMVDAAVIEAMADLALPGGEK